MDMDEFENDPHYATALKFCSVNSDNQVLPRRSMLDDTPLAAGELSCIYGKPGATKSMLAVDIACRLAAGMDRKGNRHPSGLGVLYVAAERSDQVKRRVAAFQAHHEFAPFDNLVIYDGPIDLATQSKQLTAIIAAALDRMVRHSDGDFCDIDLVIIDTIAAAMSAPTSSTDATIAAVHNMTSAAKESGAHICFVHHPPIGDATRLSGGHLTGAADVTILVEKKKSGLSNAKLVKDNALPADGRNIDYRINGIDFGIGESVGVLEYIDEPKLFSASIASKHTGKTLAAFDVFRRLAEKGTVTDADWLAAMAGAEPSVMPQAIRGRRDRARTSLLESGDIENFDNGFRLTYKQNSQNAEL